MSASASDLYILSHTGITDSWLSNACDRHFYSWLSQIAIPLPLARIGRTGSERTDLTASQFRAEN